MEESRPLLLEPWWMSLDEKLRIVREARKQGKKIALYFVHSPDPGTFRYRCYNTMQATLKSKKWQAIFFFREEAEAMMKLIKKCDLVVLGRNSRYDSVLKPIISEAKRFKKKILLDLDDLLYDKKYLYLLTNTVGDLANISYWLPNFLYLKETSEYCDGCITTNKFLSKKMEEDLGKPALVIRNSLNDEQVRASNAYLRIKDRIKEDGFVIGYFGGSPTHVNDFEVVLPELMAFLEKYPDTKVIIVGFMEFDGRLGNLIAEHRIEFLPAVDFRKLQGMMAGVDVNIAPLVINDFTNCKSELKFFEAGAVETTTIASPTYTFKQAIRDGENGFLAQPGEWYDKLEYLYNHPEENRKIAKQARKDALKHYYGKEFLQEVEKVYDEFLAMPSDDAKA